MRNRIPQDMETIVTALKSTPQIQILVKKIILLYCMKTDAMHDKLGQLNKININTITLKTDK